jgi:hypothetical protein
VFRERTIHYFPAGLLYSVRNPDVVPNAKKTIGPGSGQFNGAVCFDEHGMHRSAGAEKIITGTLRMDTP